MRIRVTALFSVLLLLSLIAFSFSVGIFDGYPLVYLQDGKPAGIYVELLNDFSKKADIPVEFEFGLWEDLLSKLRSGELDAVAAAAYSEEREKMYAYNDQAIISSWGNVFSQRGVKLESFFDLQGKRVAVAQNAISYVGPQGIRFLAERLGISCTFVEEPSYPAVFQAVVEGRADVAVVERLFGEVEGPAYKLYPSSLIFNPSEIRMLFRLEGDQNASFIPSWDEYLRSQKAQDNSLYHRLINQYLGVGVEVFPRWVGQVLLIAGALVVLLVGNALWLNHRVKTKTRDLLESNDKLKRSNETMRQLNEKLQQGESQMVQKNRELADLNEEVSSMNEELESAYFEIQQSMGRLDELIELTSQLSIREADEESFLQQFLVTAQSLIPEADYGTVSLVEGDRWRFVAAIGYQLETLRKLPMHSADINRVHSVQVIDNLYDRYDQEIQSDVREKLRKAVKPFKQSLIAPFSLGGHFLGNISLDISKNSPVLFSESSRRIMDALSTVGTAFLLLKRHAKFQDDFQKKIILSLVKALEYYDLYTRGHSERVSRYAVLIAEEVGLPREQVRKIYWASLVHDVGKIFIPQAILNKVSPLTPDEFREIKKHPEKSADVLREDETMRELASMVKSHHERWDGFGYPEGLKGEGIPFESRIITLADAYDAMTSDRPYRKKMTLLQAIEEIKSQSGKQFDPVLSRVFLNVLQRERSGVEVGEKRREMQR